MPFTKNPVKCWIFGWKRLQQSSHASRSLQVSDVGLDGTEGQGAAATMAIGVLQGSDFDRIAQSLRFPWDRNCDFIGNSWGFNGL